MAANQQSSNEIHIWPALLDVIIATLMIILLFMIILYISFYLSDALARIELRDRQSQLVEMIDTLEQKELIPQNSISVETSGDFQMLRFSSTLLFPSGRADIPEENFSSFEFLDAVGDLLEEGYHRKNLFQRLYIEGHTDTTPIKNRHYQSNWELSTARALYIADYFIKTGKIRPKYSNERLFGISGYGEYNFISSVEDLDRNRRIEILLVYSEKKE